MSKPTINDLKMFVPAKSYTVSKQFYVGLGGVVNWESNDGDLCEIELGTTRFFLQDYYVKDWANNFMMQLSVNDAQAWYEHVSDLIAAGNYGSARLNKPKQEPHGIVTYVWDPTGVLLHFTQFAK